MHFAGRARVFLWVPPAPGPKGYRDTRVNFTLIPRPAVRLMRPFFCKPPYLMGQQYNKVIKRRRRKAYLKRKKELAKQGVTRKTARTAKAAADAEKKPAAKKAAAKKATKAPAKKATAAAAAAAPAPAPEVVAPAAPDETTAPAETSTPAAE
jgi:hypothetical protein